MADGSEPPKEIRDALSDMKKYTRQKPNSHILGVGPRLTMRIYCLSNPDKSNFWHKYLRRKGQAPVIYNENAAIQTCNQLSGLLKSKGCFTSTVTFTRHQRHLSYHPFTTLPHRRHIVPRRDTRCRQAPQAMERPVAAQRG